jgi:hypothetical protein
MATLNADEHARRDLIVFRDMIGRIRATPTGGDDDAVIERMALRAEWDNVAGRITRLEQATQRGDLSPERVEELVEVARALTDLVPELTARRYRLPDLDALARAAGRPTAAQTG